MAMSSIQNNKVSELAQQTAVGYVGPASSANVPSTDSTFADMLQGQLKVSGHAKTRMESRNIQLTEPEWQRVIDGVQKAAAKGAKESLVMVDNVALVVSVKNKTVITAVDKDSLKDNVFTNIDSAVVV